MTDTRKAGTMILEHLAMFNEAVVLYETQIHTEVAEELDIAIEQWAKNEGWDVEADWRDDGTIWVAPLEWKIGEDDFTAWFELVYLNDTTTSFLIANLCGVGETELGFRFEVQRQVFGGKTQWNTFFKSIPSNIIKEISALGFLDQGKGSYFLPVRIDCKELASAWDNEDYAKVFEPITIALEKLKTSQYVFDKLLAAAEKYKQTLQLK
jgi:hypothetical protein